MASRPRLHALALIVLGCAVARSWAACQLQQFAEFPVTMSGLRPIIHAGVNGADAWFIADSGAFYSMLTPAAAAQFNLHLKSLPFGFTVGGVGGTTQASVARVNTLTLVNVQLHNVDFLVGGNDLGGGVAGLVGQNIFRAGDVEYDLANGFIRLMRAKDCGDTPLAYWAKGQPVNVLPIEQATALVSHTRGAAYLNGVAIRAIFDTGAATSVVTLEAAKRAGVTPESSGAVATGTSAGIGHDLVRSWVAPFASIKIGAEEVRNTRLYISTSLMPDVDMLIGADFFLSHRVYVAISQGKLYFTYNGGPVFALPPAPVAAPSPATAVAGAAPAETGTAPAHDADAAPSPAAAAEPAEQPADAAGFSRRGAAFAARHDYARAIADFNRACELAPSEPSYFMQRGMAHWASRETALALADFDQALKLKPDEVSTLIARATLQEQQHNSAAALADLDAAARAVPKGSAYSLNLGDLYLQAEQFPAAIAQYGDWIEVHSHDDVQKVRALNMRCWTRALWGQELNQALLDCEAALKLKPEATAVLASRAMVYLRQREYDLAIADYDRVLTEHPKNAWARYGRGVAKLRKGLSADGQADIAAATADWPEVASHAAQRGIAP
jgi:tetratricopeptide (TPR) repeat protein/predicted aspartyl protease